MCAMKPTAKHIPPPQTKLALSSHGGPKTCTVTPLDGTEMHWSR